MDNDVAIKVTNVSKSFKLPHDKQNSIKGGLISLVKGGKRTYEKQEVLKDVSFEIKKGEFFGIVGRNGSGKSTLLKLLAGIYTPTSGSIQVNGSLTPFIELGVGFNPDLTGRENIYLSGALLGFSRKQMEAMYDDIVEFAELERFMDQKLKNYSSGMQVRLAFSIAIRAQSDILLLDEVLAVGDANFQKKCFDYFKQLKKEAKTVILVTHDMDAVRKFCDKAIFIDAGKIIKEGTPNDISALYMEKNISQDKTLPSGNGIKAVRIKEITIHNEEATSTPAVSTIISEKPVIIEIIYNIEDPNNVKDILNFGIGMHSPINGYVFGYNTKMDNAGRLPPFSKEGKIELNLTKLPLNHGEYYLNVVCFSDDEAFPYDFLSEAKHFIINSKKDLNYRGILDLPHVWK